VNAVVGIEPLVTVERDAAGPSFVVAIVIDDIVIGGLVIAEDACDSG